MFQKFVSTAALAAVLVAAPAQAAQDMGLTLHNSGGSALRTGVGATASVTLRLGDRRSVKSSEKVTLGIGAGPITTRNTMRYGAERSMPAMVGFNLRPGHSANFNLAGNPVATRYTVLGAAEERREQEQQQTPDQPNEKKKQSTGDKIGWVALVAGGVMVALVAVFVATCPTCGS